MATRTPADESTILVAGEPNPDMAMLINGLMGTELFNTESTSNHGFLEGSRIVDGFELKVVVFSGLKKMNYTARQMRSKCPKMNIGLIIYCVEVEGQGLNRDGIQENIQKLNEAYGVEIWRNGLIAFMRANECVQSLSTARDLDRSFERMLETWKDQMHGYLGFKNSIFSPKVCVAPVGKEKKLSLPKREFWLSFLWSKAYDKSVKECRQGLIKIATPRAKQKRVMCQYSSEIQEMRIWEQPICLDSMPLTARTKVLMAVGGSVAVAGGAIGATVGGAIGALAIGIPSFGTAAGAGLILGGVVGGGIGGGLGSAVAGSVAAYKNEQEAKEQEKDFQRRRNDSNTQD